MKTYGMTQRRYGKEKPQAYDRRERLARLDIQECEYTDTEGEEQATVSGYSWIEVNLGNGSKDYGSVKSALIEAAYAPKDEFGFLMNAVGSLIDGDTDSDDIEKFKDMNEWRKICAEAAKALCKEYGTII